MPLRDTLLTAVSQCRHGCQPAVSKMDASLAMGWQVLAQSQSPNTPGLCRSQSTPFCSGRHVLYMDPDEDSDGCSKDRRGAVVFNNDPCSPVEEGPPEGGVSPAPLPRASPGALRDIDSRYPPAVAPLSPWEAEVAFGEDAHSLEGSCTCTGGSPLSQPPTSPREVDWDRLRLVSCTSSNGSDRSPSHSVSFSSEALSAAETAHPKTFSRSSSTESSAGRMCGPAISLRRMRSQRSATPGLMVCGRVSPRG
eukprot:GGOE01054459.1.p1 GENE.GGOE01054459.1~~GGOE01054459.1.p1  ORF type:complete len:251 (+),score=48.32 GGOE01054459.1:40-792(+)